MPVIAAQFNIPITAPCMVECFYRALSFIVHVNGFDVSIELKIDNSITLNIGNSSIPCNPLSGIALTISRDETAPVPEAVPNAQGQIDSTRRVKFLRGLLSTYSKVAHDVVNRILRHIQYLLRTPLVQPSPIWDQAYHSATWHDSTGKAIHPGAATFVVGRIDGIDGDFGGVPFQQKELPKLVESIQCIPQPTLDQELLSDAQSASFQANLRRAVLELAICVETLVKRRYFTISTPTGPAFSYIASGRNAKVLDLLDDVALLAFSRSLRAENMPVFDSVDHLMRCRTSIAHRGELSYTDNTKTINPDASLVQRWWYAVLQLRDWLNSL